MANSKTAAKLALQDLEEEVENLRAILRRWIPNRKDVRRHLILLADELKKHKRNVNVAQVTGSSTAIVGSGLIIGGFAASFFTFGVSLIVSAVGTGVAGLGGLTSSGAGIVQHFLKKRIFKNAQKAIDRDKEITQELLTCQESLKEKLRFVQEYRDLIMPQLDKIFWGNVASSLKSLGKNLVFDLVDAGRFAARAVDFAGDVSNTFFKALTTAGKVFHIGGFVVGMVLMPLDIYTLVTSSISLHQGSTSDAEEQIRQIVSEMMCPEEGEISDIVGIILRAASAMQ